VAANAVFFSFDERYWAYTPTKPETVATPDLAVRLTACREKGHPLSGTRETRLAPRRLLGRPKGSVGTSKFDGKKVESRLLLEKGFSRWSIASIVGMLPAALRHFMRARKLDPRVSTGRTEGPREVSRGGTTEERRGGPRWKSDFTTSAGYGSARP
jgi:hypothetical protein